MWCVFSKFCLGILLIGLMLTANADEVPKPLGKLAQLEELMDSLTFDLRHNSTVEDPGDWREIRTSEVDELLAYDWPSTALYAEFLHAYRVRMSRYYRNTGGSYPKEVLYQYPGKLISWFEGKLKSMDTSWGADYRDYDIFERMVADFVHHIRKTGLKLKATDRKRFRLFLWSVYKDIKITSDIRFSMIGDYAVKKNYLEMAQAMQFGQAYLVGSRLIYDYGTLWVNTDAREKNLFAGIKAAYGSRTNLSNYGFEKGQLIEFNSYRAPDIVELLKKPERLIPKAVEELQLILYKMTTESLKLYYKTYFPNQPLAVTTKFRQDHLPYVLDLLDALAVCLKFEVVRHDSRQETLRFMKVRVRDESNFPAEIKQKLSEILDEYYGD